MFRAARSSPAVDALSGLPVLRQPAQRKTHRRGYRAAARAYPMRMFDARYVGGEADAFLRLSTTTFRVLTALTVRLSF
jgi:hypothetical protein